MGADFIEKATRTFKRTWDRGRLRLGTADLFTRAPECGPRVVAGKILGDVRVKIGDRLTVEVEGGALIGRLGLTPIAEFAGVPEEIIHAIKSSSGVATGQVEQIHELAGVLEVSLC